MLETISQYKEIIEECREIFTSKMKDYGPAWRVLRTSSVTDQIYIKVNRIRTLQTQIKMVDEDEKGEFVAIVNYSVIGLIQLEKQGNQGLEERYSFEEIMNFYDDYVAKSLALMQRKNNDYGEVWRSIRISSITDLILQKILRIKQIEDNQGVTKVSEGIDANYYDILNYAVFCLIKMKEEA